MSWPEQEYFTGCDHFLDDAPRGNAIAQTAEDYDRMFNASQIMNMMLNEAYYTYWKNDELIFTEDCYNTIAQLASYPTSVQAAIEYRIKYTGTMKIPWNGKSVTTRSMFSMQ